MEARSETPINLAGQDPMTKSREHQPAQDTEKSPELGVVVRLRLDDGGVCVRVRRGDVLEVVRNGEARGSHVVNVGEKRGKRRRRGG
jgi:hypothetical protein